MSPGDIAAVKALQTKRMDDVKSAIELIEQEGTLLGAGDTVRALELGNLLFLLTDLQDQIEVKADATG